MNLQIIKSQSPNGATHYDEVNNTYYKTDGLYLYYWNDELNDWDDSDYLEMDSFFNCLVTLRGTE
ncbi:hypothetical protein [Acinetobacter seifertii]|uniref:hypothetical protein n=1 Tax=Acinetobacter seifertii TaxID=1530123 RepID=UPI00124FD3A2|nr:hypothetical protein [Acinetobacter seifertii]